MNAKHLLAFASLATLAACTEVPTGHKGVVTRYGAVTGVEGEGLVWYNPITTDVNLIDTRQLKWKSETAAYTKDVQQAKISFALTYRLYGPAVKKVYRTVGADWAETLVPQVVEQSIKDVFGQSEAVKDAINNRAVVQQKIMYEIKRRLRLRYVVVEGFEIQDISFSDAFENAVEAKQVAVENAYAARNKTVEIEERAKQRVIAATADAEAMKIKTAALAGNAKLVEYEAVQRWDGKLPQNMYGGGAMPFIGVGK